MFVAGGFVLQERCLLLGVFLMFVCLFRDLFFCCDLLFCWEVLSCWKFVLPFVFAFLFVGSTFCWELFVFAGSVVLLGPLFFAGSVFAGRLLLLGGCFASFFLGGLFAGRLFCWDLILLGKHRGIRRRRLGCAEFYAEGWRWLRFKTGWAKSF